MAKRNSKLQRYTIPRDGECACYQCGMPMYAGETGLINYLTDTVYCSYECERDEIEMPETVAAMGCRSHGDDQCPVCF